MKTLRKTCRDADILLYCIAYNDLDLQLVSSEDNKILDELKRSVFQESTMTVVIIVLQKQTELIQESQLKNHYKPRWKS